MKTTLNEVLDMMEEHDIVIVSFGLAPNPFGFCFESDEPAAIKQKFSKLLDSLTEKEEQTLRHAVFGS
jgi:hypothetical protein